MSPTRLTPILRYLIPIGCGVMVANLYYCQPLLGEFAREFGVNAEAASIINICSQLGYGLGLFFVVPLGDKVPRRGLLVVMHLLAAALLVGMPFSKGLTGLYVFSVLIGIVTTACQVFIPLAAHLASEEERGKVVGAAMGGLLTGILASRTLSGVAAQLWGWTAVYYIAALLMLVMAALLWRYIPGEEPAFKGSYGKLMQSLFRLFREQPVVRESAWIGACLFGSISAFWSTMAFFLEAPPFQYSLSLIGFFGFIGAGGALISPYVGKITDRSGPFKPMRWGILMMLAGWLLLFEGGKGIALVIAGIILIDMGMQCTHIPNLTRNYSLVPEAQTRLNTLYMTAFFIGGTLGSTLGSLAWNSYGWMGVCGAGLLMAALGSVPVFVRRKQRHTA